MKVSLSTVAVAPNGDTECDVVFELEDNVVCIYVNNKIVCSADWENNMLQLFKQALVTFENLIDE